MKYLILLFFLNSIAVKSQSTEISEAINFLNLYQNDENWAMKKVGAFVFNKYGKTLSYQSKATFLNSKNTIIDSEYIVSLDNIILIKESIHIADPKKTDDSNIIFFDLILKDEVYLKIHTKEDGQSIPDYSNKLVDQLSIYIDKRLTTDDITNLRDAIRDIFANKTIETKYL